MKIKPRTLANIITAVALLISFSILIYTFNDYRKGIRHQQEIIKLQKKYEEINQSRLKIDSIIKAFENIEITDTELITDSIIKSFGIREYTDTEF